MRQPPILFKKEAKKMASKLYIQGGIAKGIVD